jgi:hypothetical protein
MIPATRGCATILPVANAYDWASHTIFLLITGAIEAAYRHLARGQSADDEGAFTDAIYRTNQAFEGSIKEAFRVLTDKDPQRMRPHDIEKYLEDEGVFRNRILSQFTNYRQEWRNPSTHDYNLIFDEDEAFLAIISVSAFVKLLVDQIAERLSFKAARKDFERSNPEPKSETLPEQNLVDRISVLFGEFVHHYAKKNASVPIESEAQLMGALAGFLSTVAPDLMVTTGRIIRSSRHHYVDMIIKKENEEVIIELKRGQSENLIDQGMQQLLTYMAAANTENGILFMYSSNANDYAIEKREDAEAAKLEIRVIRPKR